MLRTEIEHPSEGSRTNDFGDSSERAHSERHSNDAATNKRNINTHSTVVVGQKTGSNQQHQVVIDNNIVI
jgi:hypothetical protein